MSRYKAGDEFSIKLVIKNYDKSDDTYRLETVSLLPAMDGMDCWASEEELDEAFNPTVRLTKLKQEQQQLRKQEETLAKTINEIENSLNTIEEEK